MHLITMSDLTPLAALYARCVALSVSSNIQTAIAFVTLFLNYYASAGQDVHAGLANMQRLQGRPWLYTIGIMSSLYLPAISLTLVLVTPALLIFFWVMVPIFVVLWAYAMWLQNQISKKDTCMA